MQGWVDLEGWVNLGRLKVLRKGGRKDKSLGRRPGLYTPVKPLVNFQSPGPPDLNLCLSVQA